MSGDIYFAGKRLARADFQQAARRIARDMIDRGLTPDDNIAVLMRNDLAYLIMAEAARLVGARYASINWHSAPQEVEHILRDSGAKILYAHADLLEPVMTAVPQGVTAYAFPTPVEIMDAYGVGSPQIDGALEITPLLVSGEEFDGEPEKLRGMFAYTSGSTGKPKGIKRSFDPEGPDQWLTYQGLARNLMGANEGDRMYVAAPLYHSAPNALSLFVLSAGDVDVYVDPKFDPERFLQVVQDHRITHAYIVPTMMIRMLKLPPEVRDKYDVSTLRYTISTGSPCPVEVKRAMIDWFGPIHNESYGASEIGFMTLISSQEALAKPGSVGKILPGGSGKVLNDDFEEVPTGEVGVLYIHLPMFGDYEYSNKTGDLEGQRQGAHSTVGDMGYVDEDGYIYISDRKKDMIISGGANIFPAEIEAQLILMPEIADCAVFGAPHPEFGEQIVAAVRCQPGATVSLDSVRTFLEPRLAKFKLPRKLDLHEELPRQDSGKIYKAKLRAPYWEDAGRQV